MNEGSESVGVSNVVKGAFAAVIVLLLIGAGVLWVISGRGQKRLLMPLLPTPTPATLVPQQEPQIVAFTSLNDNPLAYLNQVILVQGDYFPLDENQCLDPVGPSIRWSLTADNLQLDTFGFEKIVRILPVGTNMTVEGIWRLYQGPLGCGKGPPRDSMWYLDAKKIIQPNPLVSEGGQAIAVDIRDNTLGFPQINVTEVDVNIMPTATLVTDTMTGEAIASPTSSGQLVPTQTPVAPGEITQTATVASQPIPTVPLGTPDPNATLPPATDSATAVPTDDPGNSTPTFTPDALPIPATATDTSGGGYPGPPTATPTASPNPYP